MTDEVSGVASQAAELEAVLLDAKLSVPTRRQDSVSRADLVLRARSSESRIVAVTAPAGYGKSTMLAEWAESEDRPVAWVSLDRFDDDPVRAVVGPRSCARADHRPARSGRRHAGCRHLDVGPRGAPPGVGVPLEPDAVRADPRRPSRDPVRRLSRRTERGDLRHPAWVPAADRKSLRAAARATAAGRRGGGRDRGGRPGPRRGWCHADLRPRPSAPDATAGCGGDRTDRGVAGRSVPRLDHRR